MENVITNHFSSLLATFGFEVHSADGQHILFARKNSGSDDYVLLRFRRFDSRVSIASYLTAWKAFPEVEGLLEKYFKKHKINQHLVTIFKDSERNESLENWDLNVDLENVQYNQIINELLDNELLPFLNSFPTLNEVQIKVDLLNGDFDEINKFLFAPQPIRRMIILALLGKEDYTAFSERIVKNLLAKAKTQPKSNIAIYAHFIEDLKKELDSL